MLIILSWLVEKVDRYLPQKARKFLKTVMKDVFLKFQSFF